MTEPLRMKYEEARQFILTRIGSKMLDMLIANPILFEQVREGFRTMDEALKERDNEKLKSGVSYLMATLLTFEDFFDMLVAAGIISIPENSPLAAPREIVEEERKDGGAPAIDPKKLH